MRIHTLLTVVFALFAACGGAARATVVASAVPAPAVAPARHTPETESATLVAVDIFGLPAADGERFLATHVGEIRRLGDAMVANDSSVDRDAILAELERAGDLAFVEPSLVGYYEDHGMAYYLTLDVVEKKDARRRIAFAPAPVGELADPDGLIAGWQAYDAKVTELMRVGTLSPQRVACPAFHCFGDPSHPELRALATKFAEHVPTHRDELLAILRNDRRERVRAAAAYLLAYTNDGQELVRVLQSSMRDESPYVRNSVMRVLAEIALYHPEIEIPLDPVLAALDLPTTTDRNKASAVLAFTLQKRGVSAETQRAVIDHAGDTLLAMLRLRQPNNHDFAYAIFKALSGESYAERDYAAWQAWLRRNRSPATPRQVSVPSGPP